MPDLQASAAATAAPHPDWMPSDMATLVHELHDALAEADKKLRPKPWWLSKTLIVNALLLGLAAAEAQLKLLQPLLGVDVYALLAFALPVVNAMLRVITSAPLTLGSPR